MRQPTGLIDRETAIRTAPAKKVCSIGVMEREASTTVLPAAMTTSYTELVGLLSGVCLLLGIALPTEPRLFVSLAQKGGQVTTPIRIAHMP